MPKTVFLKRPGQIETCTACDVSFTMRPGESTSSLVHRYTEWREAHATCARPVDDPGDVPDTSPTT